jgi:hypothetical protein
MHGRSTRKTPSFPAERKGRQPVRIPHLSVAAFPAFLGQSGHCHDVAIDSNLGISARGKQGVANVPWDGLPPGVPASVKCCLFQWKRGLAMVCAPSEIVSRSMCTAKPDELRTGSSTRGSE